MKNIKFIYLLILLCCTICKIDAQPPHTFTQYKTSDGLYQKRLCIFSKTPKDLFGLPLGMEFINLMVIILKITKTEKGIIMDSITAE